MSTHSGMADAGRHEVGRLVLGAWDAFCDQAEACVTHRALEEMTDIDIPTLITVGDTDILTPPAHARELHERVRGSVLHVWPEMGHAPFWEIPDAFNRLNREFLEAH